MKADLKRIKLHPDQHENEDEHVKEYLKHDWGCDCLGQPAEQVSEGFPLAGQLEHAQKADTAHHSEGMGVALMSLSLIDGDLDQWCDDKDGIEPVIEVAAVLLYP